MSHLFCIVTHLDFDYTSEKVTNFQKSSISRPYIRGFDFHNDCMSTNYLQSTLCHLLERRGIHHHGQSEEDPELSHVQEKESAQLKLALSDWQSI